MKLGFFTACFPDWDLAAIAEYAARAGFDALEIADWPGEEDRPFTARHLGSAGLTDADVERISSLLAAHGLEATSIGYYGNNLDADAETRERTNQHVHHCIDAAERLGIPTVGTFVGRDLGRSVRENMVIAEKVFAPLVDHAAEAGVKLVIENCVMEGWHPDGYPANIAYSPELWDWMGSIGLYLNYDPSHLMCIGIDPVVALRDHLGLVAHVQAKDIEISQTARNRFGWPGEINRSDPWAVGWWRYRVPGLGDVPWRRVIDILHEAGYEGAVSIEHEDPVWGGDDRKVATGLGIAAAHLDPLVRPDKPLLPA